MLKLKYFSTIIFVLLFSGIGHSQSQFIPSAFRVGLDLTGVGYTLFNSNYNQMEANADLQIKKGYLTIDYGVAERSYSNEYEYRFSGSFFRAGYDFNIIPQDPDNNVIFIGFRYARAFYNDHITYSLDHPIFGGQDYSYENPSINGRWFEGVGGVKVRVWKHIFLGYTLRLKFAQKTSGASQFSTYEIPGYGKAAGNSSFGFNYHIFYRIPLR